MTQLKRTVFFISDRTGITAETLGNSLLTQFEDIEFEQIIYPFVDSNERAYTVVARINELCEHEGDRPLIFATVVNPEIREILVKSKGMFVDFFNTFIAPMEAELGMRSCYRVGKSHGISNGKTYNHRIEAINYALSCDDGIGLQNYGDAELILVGVSRCGKTPTSLYLALQFGIQVANYPFTEEDMEHLKLPAALKDQRKKLFGLTIDPLRLQAIRSERRPGSRYASIAQCELEVKKVESFFRQEGIPCINTTSFSIEEISAKILAKMELKRHFL